jgi:hypothetical protein
MPNHVTHRVVVTGPSDAIARFKAAFLFEKTERDFDGTEHRYTHFDFNVLVPMPQFLRQTESSSSLTHGLLVLGRTDIVSDFGMPTSLQDDVARFLSFDWVKEAGVTDYEGLKALLLKNDPTCVEVAQRAVKAYELYGHTSWYGWSIENWGTKWNSYSFREISDRDGRLEFMFDTAWSVPEPIFDALAERSEVKDLSITIHAFDEGWNFAFVGSIRGGYFLGQTVDASDALYQDVYGEPAASAD